MLYTKVKMSILVFALLVITLICIGIIRCSNIYYTIQNNEGDLEIKIIIDERMDVVWDHSGLPDPFVFQQGDYYYIFGTALRFFRTQSFEPGDMQPFVLKLNFGPETHRVVQIWGFRVYKCADGKFHGYATLHYGHFKTAVAYFTPHDGEEWTEETPIQRWNFDKILVGDVEKNINAYDSNVKEDEDGSLYFISNLEYKGNVHIFAWQMEDPGNINYDIEPRAILSPEGFMSEYRNQPGSMQIVESTIIHKIQDKYVLLYSVGDFDDHNYKIGVAYSDQLIPPPGEEYKKVLVPDDDGVWGVPGNKEIQYLLQTQKRDWPNYVGDILNGPGIGNIVLLEDGYYLVFHGRRQGTTRLGGAGRYVWKMPVEININDEIPMEKWIKPAENLRKQMGW